MFNTFYHHPPLSVSARRTFADTTEPPAILLGPELLDLLGPDNNLVTTKSLDYKSWHLLDLFSFEQAKEKAIGFLSLQPIQTNTDLGHVGRL
jgi:hypothetical protein